MKNFINIRLETYNQIKTSNDIKHNLRIVKSLSQENQNQNIYFNKNGDELKKISYMKKLKKYLKNGKKI